MSNGVGKSAVDILVDARSILEKGWCQGHMALDENGNEVLVCAAHACQWCALGAIVRCSDPGSAREEAAKLLHDAIRLRKAIYGGRLTLTAVGTISLTAWNDFPGTTQAEVLSTFTAAIEGAKRAS